MHVGVMRLALDVPGARSLKDKRHVVRSFKERVRSRLSISIAEIDHQNKLQRATFGVAVVSSDAAVCEELLEKVIAMASSLPDALVSDKATEIIPFGEGGLGVRGGIEQLGEDLVAYGDDEAAMDEDEEEDE